MNADARLLGRLRHASHRPIRRARRAWPDVHDRAGQRAVRGRASRSLAPLRRRPHARVAHSRTSAGFWSRARPATASFAGSGPRRASSTWRRRPSSTPSGICRPRSKASRSGSCSSTCRPSSSSRASRSATSRDALTPDEALGILRRARADAGPRAKPRCARRATPPTRPRRAGSATPTTRSRRLCREGVAAGWTAFQAQSRARPRRTTSAALTIAREEIGPDRDLMVDANQVWDVDQAIAWMRELAEFDPWWIEEPTSPDDVLGHARIARALAADRRRDGRARARTGSSSSSSCRRMPSRSARSTAAGSAASTRSSPCC